MVKGQMQPRLLSRLFSLSGRLNVPEAFALHLLLSGLGYAVIYVLSQGADWRREIEIRLIVEALCGLGLLFLVTKRLHDHGWSGWWAMLGLPAIPLGAYRSWRVTLLNPDVLTGNDPWWYMPAVLLSLALVLFVMGVFFIPGGSHPNRYGPSPRGTPDLPAHSA